MFLVALYLEFQPLYGQIIYRDHVPSLDSIVYDLVAEETRLHLFSTLASTPTSESEIVLAIAPWSSFSGGQHSTTTKASSTDRTRPYCTICKGTSYTDYFCHHSRSCNHYNKTGHTECECFHRHPELLVQAQQHRKQQKPLPLRIFSVGPHAMAVHTDQSLPTDI